MIAKVLKTNYPLLLIITFISTLLLVNINKPFIGHHDWNGAFWGNTIRDFSLSIAQERPLQVSLDKLIFSHYTPLLPLLFLFSSIMFGFSEQSLRLVPVIFSMVMLVFVYKSAKYLYGNLVGLIATLFIVLTPMFLYFGKLPDHEPVVTSLLVITFYFFITSEKKKIKPLFFVFLTLSLIESWPAFFMLIPLSVASYFVKKITIKKIAGFYLIALLVLFFHFLSVFLVKGQAGLAEFYGSGIQRAIGQNLYFGETEYTIENFIKTESRYAVIQLTRILTALSIIWIVSFCINLKRKKVNSQDYLLLILLVYPALFILSFSRLAFIHDYKLYHFLPFIGIASALVVASFLKRVNSFLTSRGLKSRWYSFVQVLVIILLAALVFFERAPYLKALQDASFNYPGYELGKIISTNTNLNSPVLINSLEHKAFFEVFTNYYAGRNLAYGSLSLEDFQKNVEKAGSFDYFVIIKSRTYDNRLLEYLSAQFKSQDFGDYLLFKI